MRSHLATSAQNTIGALIHGDTPLRWPLTKPGDLVSGAAFGTQQTRIDAAGTQVTDSGQPVELGLRIDAVIDLQRYPILQFEIDSTSGAQFALVVRESLAGPLCVSDAREVPVGVSRRQANVVELRWTCNGVENDVPTRAAMLRLRLHIVSGERARVINARLLPTHPLSPAQIAMAVPIAARWMPRTREIRTLDAPAPDNVPVDAWPMFTLGLDGRVEQSLQAIDQIRNVHPAAIIVADGDWQTLVTRSERWTPVDNDTTHAWLAWCLVVGQALVLLWIRLRPLTAPRWQAALELLGVVAVPLWLVSSGRIGDDLGAPVVAAIAITLLFAASLLRESAAPRQPAGRASRRGTAVAVVTVLASIVIVLVLGDGNMAPTWPSSTRLLRYLAWAAVQQLIVCVIVADRFERIFGSARWAIPASALVFALLHAPNAMLMQFTLLAGLIWVWNWQRHRALFANTVAHAASGVLLATQLPSDWLRSAEISARYFLF
ncbi:MAG: type II CAAX endopeptidase family protein [Dokdonella sp.]